MTVEKESFIKSLLFIYFLEFKFNKIKLVLWLNVWQLVKKMEQLCLKMCSVITSKQVCIFTELIPFNISKTVTSVSD